jgi:GTP 3',8-cyclase
VLANGIQAAYKVGFDPLKLNVVVIPGVNDHEVLDLAALTIDRRWHIRFIEFMPIGNFQLFSDRFRMPTCCRRVGRTGKTTAVTAE